jgi:glycosidase
MIPGTILPYEIFHRSERREFLNLFDDVGIRVRLRTAKEEVSRAEIVFSLDEDSEFAIEMGKVASDNQFDYFEAIIKPIKPSFYYYFRLFIKGELVYYTRHNIQHAVAELDRFFCNIEELHNFRVPDWAQDAVCYQIFPERFYNGDPKNDLEEVERWGSIPKPNNFFGGDLKGIEEKLGYLKDLGISLIYLTPIFESNSNHKYNIKDYYKIDPHFGDKETLKELVDKAHSLGIRIILDGVFNHCSRDFFAFQDVVKKGRDSKYLNWFTIYDLPIRYSPKPTYKAWYNVIDMPKFNMDNPQTREYLLDVATYWIKEADIDGWRLDTGMEIGHSFWKEFRRRVKNVKPDAYIVGEILGDETDWIQGDQFDAVMDYRFRELVLKFFALNSINAKEFNNYLTRIKMERAEQPDRVMFNLIGSHDTPRFLTLCRGNVNKMLLAVLFQMTYTGLPVIYYGDEIGLEGGMDPGCRKCMIWDENQWNKRLFETYRTVIRIRNNYKALRRGNFQSIIAEENNVYGFLRSYGTEHLLVLINNSPYERILAIDLGFSRFIDLITEKTYNLPIKINPYTGFVLKCE